jgi:hypothetical protein
VAALLWVSVFAGCAKQEVVSQDGNAELRVTLPHALSRADVRSVRVEVRGPGISTPITAELIQVGTVWQGTVGNIPAGVERSFDAFAYDVSGGLLFQGSAGPLTVDAGSTVAAFLMLQQVNIPPPFQNEAPRISSVVLTSNVVQPGESLFLTASAYDANGDALSFSWTGAAGSFGSSHSDSTSWTAPSFVGTQRLRLEVTDSKGTSASVSFDVYVQQEGATGSADLTVGFNSWPEVRVMQGTPSVLAPGATSQLSATVVDADGDALEYSWYTDCLGSFSNAASSNPSFTLTSVPYSGRCVFQVSVSDGNGGVHSGTLILQAGNAPRVNVRPKVDSSWQSASQANGGGRVILGLTAHDPDGSVVSFSWSASAGQIRTSSWNSTSSEAEWIAPACFDEAVSVTATVTDVDGATLQHGFTIAPTESAKCGAGVVTGVRRVYNVLADGSLVATMADDLSSITIGAYVPTEDGSGFVYVAGTGQADGTFIIPGVVRTPYFFRFGSSYIWSHSRFLDLSYTSLGRPFTEQEPAGTRLAFEIDGLEPWQSSDDLQLHSTGAGIGYFTKSCATGFPSPGDGGTTLRGSIDYGSSLKNCGNVAARIDPSQGDILQVTQHVSRKDLDALPTGLTLVEARMGFQAYGLSGPSDGGTGDGGTGDGGTLVLKGMMRPLSTTTQGFHFRASEFEPLVLAAHPNAVLYNELVNLGTLPYFNDYGQYDGYPDLALATNSNPGQGDFSVTFQYGNPYPSYWPKLVTTQATSLAPFSVGLADGGTSRTAWYSAAVYSQTSVWEGTVQPLLPMVGPPRDVRINGAEAMGGTTVSGVGTSPVVSWVPPATGSATRYQARLYEIYPTSTGATSRTLVGYYSTTDTQLRLPNLVAGKTYFVLLYALSMPGTDLEKPFMYKADYHFATVFSAMFQP